LKSIALTEPATVRRAAILWRRDASRSRAALEFSARLLTATQRLPGAAASRA
jgi:LysR family cyn operon transcriptional activator